jgi:uncharacterized protein (TIGR00369 family)
MAPKEQTMNDQNFAAVVTSIHDALNAQGFMKLVGAEIVSVKPGEVELALDRRPEVLQHNGFFHGGVTAFLVDNATTVAAGTLINRENRTVLTAEYKLNFVAPAAGDRLSCRAKVLKPGKNLIVVEAKVYCRMEGEEKLTAVALATIACIDRPKAA